MNCRGSDRRRGNLFGTVNVVNALVVLLALPVGVAGVTLAFFDNTEPALEPDLDTTNATLELGTQPAYVVDAINEGDSYEPNDLSRVTITDIHFALGAGGDIRESVRVEGERDDGRPPRVRGRAAQVRTRDREQHKTRAVRRTHLRSRIRTPRTGWCA